MLKNTGKLAGQTLFITGASRGIGKAIALKAAKDGANIVIAAKTAEPHPKLPGTIYTAADEITSAGGKALPCVVDIRDEKQVQSAVQQAIQKFGGIDILVNNASAISLTGTLETDMKRYDLMHQINTRGTFVVSKTCLPHLMKSKNPHILNLSPPLNLNPAWFAHHVAYTMAKYGMSMCVLGMAKEFKDDGIAVNALWPRTAISTAAMDMLGGSDIANKCRKVDILADAAYFILSKPSRSFTGNFVIDDEILKEAGITNFDQYAFKPGADLLPDFFLGDPEVAKEMLYGKESAPKSEPSAAGDSELDSAFKKLSAGLTPEIVSKTQAVYVFDIQGENACKWVVDLKNGSGSVERKESSPEKVDVVFKVGAKDLLQMMSGKLSAPMAFMAGKIKLEGDMGKAMKVEKVLKKVQAKL